MFDEMSKSRWSEDERLSASITLKLLYQLGSVESYWHHFQDCLDKIGELPENHVLSYFVGGLQDYIKKDVKAWRPRSLREALAVAKSKEFSRRGFIYKEQDAAIEGLGSLKQLRSVQDYHEQFEKLVSKVENASVEFTEFVVTCFVDGLQEDIQEYVRAQRPHSWADASCLAKLQEIRLTFRKRDNVSVIKESLETEILEVVTDKMDVEEGGNGGPGSPLNSSFVQVQHGSEEDCCNSPQVGPAVLVLSSTSELGSQKNEETINLRKPSNISCTSLYGGELGEVNVSLISKVAHYSWMLVERDGIALMVLELLMRRDTIWVEMTMKESRYPMLHHSTIQKSGQG